MLIYKRDPKTHVHYTYSPLSESVQKFLLGQLKQKIKKRSIIKTKLRIKNKHLFQYKDRGISIETVRTGIPISIHLFIRVYTFSQLSLVGNHRQVFNHYLDNFRSKKNTNTLCIY